MIGIVQAKAANQTNFFTRERSKQLLDSEDILGHLCGGVESGAYDLVGLHGFLLVDRQANWETYVSFCAREGLLPVLSSLESTGSPIWT